MRLRLLGALLGAFMLAGTVAGQETSNPTQDPSANGTQGASHDASTANGSSGHKTHIKLGGFEIGAGYTHVSGFAPWYGYGLYGPRGYYPYYAYSFWDPIWGPARYYPVDIAYSQDKGQLQLKADPKDAEVYIDGAYAGTARHLKTIWLEPGAYDLSFSAPGREPFQRRVYVLTGKTLNITAKLLPQNAPAASSEN